MMRATTVYLPAILFFSFTQLASAMTCSMTKEIGEQMICPGPGCRGVVLPFRAQKTMDAIASATSSAALNEVSVWETKIEGDKVFEMEKKPSLEFASENKALSGMPTIELNTSKKHQTMYGFGAALTEACTMHIDRLPAKLKAEFLRKAFGPEGANFNLIRLPMGATDFSDNKKGNYSYADTKGNKPDPELKSFNMSRDEKSFAIIREARKINPNLKVMVTPWSAPPWMKDNGSMNGGGLKPEYRQAYADYFVKTIKEYEKRGIPVDSLTIQNEPAYASYGVPSMGISPKDQGEFIRDYLGPTMEKNGISKKIFGHDHNWTQSESDADVIAGTEGVKKYMKGIAYHCYSGEKWGMWDTVNHHPDMEIMQTECSGSDAGYPHASDFHWWLDTQTVGAVNMGTTGSIAWNLCLDDKHGPVNWGKDDKGVMYSGCTNCRGLVEMDFSEKDAKVKYNPEFHALSQVSRFMVPGTKRIEVNGKIDDKIQSTAFERPDGSIVVVAENLKNEPMKFRVQTPDCREVVYELSPQGAATFVIGEKPVAEAAKPARKPAKLPARK